MFAGNLTRQPYFKNVNYRVATDLKNTDLIMDRVFWVGIYPGLNDERLDYIADRIESYFKGNH